jgi:hypothetical protein
MGKDTLGNYFRGQIEKELEWEIGHVQMLARLDEEIRERIWYDNRFWPLD